MNGRKTAAFFAPYKILIAIHKIDTKVTVHFIVKYTVSFLFISYWIPLASRFGNLVFEIDLGLGRFFSVFWFVKFDSPSVERILFSSTRELIGSHSPCESVRASAPEQSPAYLI